MWIYEIYSHRTTDPEWGLMDPIKLGTPHKGANKQRESKTDSVSKQALWFTSRYCAAFHEYSEDGISTLQVWSSPKLDSPEVWFRISSCSIFPSVVNKTQKNSSLYLVWSLFFIIILRLWNMGLCYYKLCPSVWTGFMVLTRTLRPCGWCKRLFLLYLKRKETLV